MERPTRHETYLRMARTLSFRSTCARRNVGCILVDKDGHVLATGYNGVPQGMDHCIDTPCPGAGLSSGMGLEQCQAIHAEQNALLQCPDVRDIHIVYCTTAPCMHCVKLLANTGATSIFYIEPYPGQQVQERFWLQSRKERFWVYHPLDSINVIT